VSFGIGFGLGGGQPMVMSLLHTHAPPGRMGEAAGVRMSISQSMAVAVPLVFGAFGATFGLAPVLWAVGLCLTSGGVYARRRL
jgi:MFS family permease